MTKEEILEYLSTTEWDEFFRLWLEFRISKFEVCFECPKERRAHRTDYFLTEEAARKHFESVVCESNEFCFCVLKQNSRSSQEPRVLDVKCFNPPTPKEQA